jgi:dephospho-CoA kinase
MSKRWPDKTVVGLTGNIATGKSVVGRLAAEKGALVLDADKIVHQILENDPSMQASVAVAFGSEVRRSDGTIDRAALAEIVFSDESALRDLELLLHPAVRKEIFERIEAGDASVVVIEAIKLLEGELVDVCDRVWVTRCPRDVQIRRLMVCRGMDAETAAVRVNAQNPQAAKVARADVVIDTKDTIAETKEQFERAWKGLPRASEPAGPARRPEPEPEAKPAEASAEEQPTPAEDVDVTVRRARPSDIPTILLLINKATGGAVRMTRAEMLQSFGERSYLIGQVGTEIGTVVGWTTDSTTAVCVEQIFAHPLQGVEVTGPPLLAEIERSARELICEVAFAFLPYDAPDEIRQVLAGAGYQEMNDQEMRRAWQQTVEERQPDDTYIMGKVLRDVRVA